MKQVFKKILVPLLTFEAKLALRRHKPRVVAITGSVGKTSTKDAIAAALATRFTVRKSQKSFNSEIGVPLAILGLKNPWSNPLLWIGALTRGAGQIFARDFPSILVLEVGADRPGDISSLSKWLSLDVAVFTSFAKTPVHVENFPSREAVLREKLSLLKALKPDGVVVLNYDDEEFKGRIKEEVRSRRIIEYGLRGGDVRGKDEHFLEKNGFVSGYASTIEVGGKENEVRFLGVLGVQHVYPALAACAFIEPFHLAREEAFLALEMLHREPGRMRIIEGVKETTIIDDTYNSSPVAVRRALETLSLMPAGNRRIAVLGEMAELGEFSKDEHVQAGKQAGAFVDFLIAVGKHAKNIAHGALTSGLHESKILEYEESSRVGKELEHLLEPGDVVLIKGSQSERMERVVLEIMAHPEKAGELLARQEKEWKRR